MPTGIIHGDPVRNHVLFHEDELSGILGFYSASDDYLLWDLALLLNDWCLQNYILQEQLLAALATAYSDTRKLDAAEKSILPVFLQMGLIRKILMDRDISNTDGAAFKADLQALMGQWDAHCIDRYF